MAISKKFSIIMSIIIVVVMIIVVIYVFAGPSKEEYGEGIEWQEEELIYGDDMGAGSYLPFLYITESDTDLEKIEKIFKYFYPDYVYINLDSNRRLYNKFLLEGGDDVYMADVYINDVLSEKGAVTTIKEALEDWNEENPNYEIACELKDSAVPKTELNSQCWHSSLKSIDPEDEDGYGCAVYYTNWPGAGYHSGVIKGKKTIRVMWYIDDDNNVYPIITLCGEHVP